MLSVLRNLLAPLDPAPDAPDLPCAVAALLVEAAEADGASGPLELEAAERFLARLFALDAAEAAALRRRGAAARAGASDLVRFTRLVKTGLSVPDRERLMEALWRVVLAEGGRDPHENALMRKLAPLIAVEDHASAAARRRAAEG